MNRKIPLPAVVLFLALAPTAAMTSDAPSLQEIMQGLRNSLVEISDGLLADDFELVAHGPASIAEHPKIPATQVQLVAAELGPEMAAFKQLDNFVHDLSLEISAAARAQDRRAAISGYQRMIEGCLDCHRAYKERVAAVLRPQVEPQSVP